MKIAPWLGILLLASSALAQPPEIVDLGQFRVDTNITSFIDSLARVEHDRGDGSFVVVWSSYSSLPGSFSTDVLARRFTAEGNPLGDEILINLETDEVQLQPSLSPDPVSGFVVVWGELDPNLIQSLGVTALRIDPAGQPIGAQIPVDTMPNEQTATSVSHTPDGGFLTVWEEGGNIDGSQSGIRGRRYDAAGGAIGDEFQVNAYTNGSQDRPRVRYGPDGTAVVVWHGAADGVNTAVQARLLDASGVPQGTDIPVSDAPTATSNAADVSFSSDGGFAVVWNSSNGPAETNGILVRRFNAAGQPLGEPFRVDQSDDGPQLPRILHGPNDSFLVAWHAVDADDFTEADVLARLYDSLGQPIGDAFRVNDAELGRHRAPCLSFGPDGQLVVVWLEDLTLNSTGIFAKRYQVDVAPPAPVVEVPTLGHLGIALLALLLATFGVRRLT